MSDSKDILEPPGPKLAPREHRSHGKVPPPDDSSQSRRIDRVPVPVLKGRLLELLGAHQPRVAGDDAIQFDHIAKSREDSHISLDTPDKRAAVALACIVLENLRRRGGSRVPEQPLVDVLEALLPTLTARDMMQLEIEAYEMLEWIGVTVDPDLADHEPANEDGPSVEYDPSQSHIDLVQRAIAERFDLRMTYYTGGRGELTTRRITPESLEAEKYLRGFCHTRQDTRVFRLSRIARLEPIGGVPVKSRPARKRPAAKTDPGKPQKSLFDID